MADSKLSVLPSGVAITDADLWYSDQFATSVKQATTALATYMASKLPAIGAIRTILTAKTEFYVATTGNDSNPGSLASPWATIQHAMNFISGNIDCAGFLARINVGSGTFVGVGLKQVVGGPLEIKGNGVANTFIGNGPNDGVFNKQECVSVYPATGCQFWLNQMTLKPTAGSINGMIFELTGPNEIIYGEDQDGAGAAGALNFDNTAATAVACVAAFGPHAGVLDSAQAVNAFSCINTGAGFTNLQLGAVHFIIGHYTVTGTPALSQPWVSATDESWLIDFGATFTGAATGQRFFCDGTSILDANDATGTKYPGSTVGTLKPGGLYSGITDYTGTVAGLPTATIANARAFVNNALAPAFAAAVAGGGAVYTPVYADGTIWRCG